MIQKKDANWDLEINFSCLESSRARFQNLDVRARKNRLLKDRTIDSRRFTEHFQCPWRRELTSCSPQATMRRKLLPGLVLLVLLSTVGNSFATAECYARTPAALRSLKVGVIVPRLNAFPWSLPLAGPGIMYAVETVKNRTDFLEPVSNLSVVWGDSRCSDVHGPLVAFHMYVNESVDAFVGPGCDYAVAPIARFSPFWNKPVITGCSSRIRFLRILAVLLKRSRILTIFSKW